ncbi:MAG: cytochrome C oxidase subunit IV family protein [Candidatus Sulfotelmatobacter sp.]
MGAASAALGENTMHDAALHDDSKGQYFWVWGALLVLTVVEIILAYRQVFQPVAMLEVLLALSVVKSALIIGYFMHLKFESALMRWMVTLSVVGCFIIMYFFFFPDAGRILNLGVK